MTAFTAARAALASGIEAGVFPAATVEVGNSVGPQWTDALGTLDFDSPETATLDTPFDLASLTKVIATTTIVMELIRIGAMQLEQPVAELFQDWRGADREQVTIADLLEHAAGLPARLVDQPPATRREFEHEIGAMPLEYVPRTQSIYSDLGFILLAFAAADAGAAPLETLFDRVVNNLSSGLAFSLPVALRRRAAPTRPMDIDPRRGRVFTGEVHDNYAAALSGVAGHAGVFGSAPAVGTFARAMLRAARGDTSGPPPFAPELVHRFTRKSAVPGSSRALGWDTMLATSSCGTMMTAQAFGHVGFTGTSLWIDPVRDRYFVLLTNRVAGGGTIDDMRTVRRAFHDALGNV